MSTFGAFFLVLKCFLKSTHNYGSKKNPDLTISYLSHNIHVWYIYLHLVDFYGTSREIYHTWIGLGILSWHYIGVSAAGTGHCGQHFGSCVGSKIAGYERPGPICRFLGADVLRFFFFSPDFGKFPLK